MTSTRSFLGRIACPRDVRAFGVFRFENVSNTKPRDIRTAPESRVQVFAELGLRINLLK